MNNNKIWIGSRADLAFWNRIYCVSDQREHHREGKCCEDGLATGDRSGSVLGLEIHLNHEVIQVAHPDLIGPVALEKERDRDTRSVWHRVKAI